MTAKDRIDYLLGKALAGELNPAERQELDAVLASEPERADAFIRDSRFGALLSLTLEEGESAERFERALRARHHAAGENADFIQQLHRRSRGPVPKRRSSSAMAIWGLAAGVLLALGVLIALLPSNTPPEVVQAPVPPPAPKISVPHPSVPVPPRAPARMTPAETRPGLPEPPPPVVPEPKLAPEPVPAVAAKKPVAPAPNPVLVEKPRETRVAAATVVGAFGHTFAVDGDRRIPLHKGDSILEGQGLFTWGARSRVQVRFGDETRLQLHGDTALREVAAGSEEGKDGKRLQVVRGALTAEISKQPRLRPMIIDTPRGEMKILGTTIRIQVDADRTRLEVTEGRVRLTRKKDKKFAYVGTGQYAVAAEGESITPRTLVLKRAFQNGSHPGSDYAGADDTAIYELQPDRNLGTARLLETGGKQLGVFLRWDLSQIARGSKVREAAISLRPVTNYPVGEVYQLFEVKRPWVEGEATWNHYAQGKRWQVAGGRGPADRGARVLGVVVPGDGPTCRVKLNALGVALVQSWIRNPSRNYGVVLAGETAHRAVGFASGESPGRGERPWLTLTYVPGKK